MFSQLDALLAEASASLLLTITRSPDGRLCVTVLPQMPEGTKTCAGLATPLSVIGTAAELDAGLAQALSEYVAPHVSLQQQVQASAAVLAAAKTELAAKVTKATQKPAAASKAKPTSVAPTTPAAGAACEDDDADAGEPDAADDAGQGSTASPAKSDPVSLF
jgi:PRTRC genetic system protein E